MKRQVVLDTETTGFKPEEGHRIVEIGCVELIDNKKTGRTFHTLINPERLIPLDAQKVHNISDEDVKNSPFFRDIVDEFLNFIAGSEIVIHNADFDIKMINAELDRLNKGKIWNHVKNSICTLKLDKMLYAEERGHSLDAICKRFEIDLSVRDNGHGALVDSELLATAFIKINETHPPEVLYADIEQVNWTRPPVKRYSNLNMATITLSPEEQQEHANFLNKLAEKNKVTPIFSKTTSRPSI